jgi:hypothetical protein
MYIVAGKLAHRPLLVLLLLTHLRLVNSPHQYKIYIAKEILISYPPPPRLKIELISSNVDLVTV